MKPTPNLTSNLEDWLILADYYEDMKYDNVVQFVKSAIKEWVEWLNKYKYEPYPYEDGYYAWVTKVRQPPKYKYNCYLRGKLYYKICPLESPNYRPEVVYETKEEAYFDLFLAYLENK